MDPLPQRGRFQSVDEHDLVAERPGRPCHQYLREHLGDERLDERRSTIRSDGLPIHRSDRQHQRRRKQWPLPHRAGGLPIFPSAYSWVGQRDMIANRYHHGGVRTQIPVQSILSNTTNHLMFGTYTPRHWNVLQR